MNSLGIAIDQCIIGIFTLWMMYRSLYQLNQCSKHTKLTVRVPLILFLTASVGTMLLLTSGVRIEWSYALVIIGVSIHLSADRRNYHCSTNYKPNPVK